VGSLYADFTVDTSVLHTYWLWGTYSALTLWKRGVGGGYTFMLGDWVWSTMKRVMMLNCRSQGKFSLKPGNNGYWRCLEIDSSLRMESILCKMHFCHMVRCFESCLYKVFKSEHLNWSNFLPNHIKVYCQIPPRDKILYLKLKFNNILKLFLKVSPGLRQITCTILTAYVREHSAATSTPVMISPLVFTWWCQAPAALWPGGSPEFPWEKIDLSFWNLLWA